MQVSPSHIGVNKASSNANKANSRDSELKIYEELGAGSFGKVYRAFDPSLNKVVAIKMIELDTSGEIEDVLLELHFLSELRCQQITRHYYASLYDSVLFVIMEYCAAGSCMNMLRQYSVFREDSAAYVIQQVLQGLHHIHSQNKIHRDLKSANILVTQDYQVKIADFGVSAQLSSTITSRNSFMGTPYWMAPEVIEASHYNTAVDIWSLGIVAFELITGNPPYRKLQPNDALLHIVRDEPPPLPNFVRGYPISKTFAELVAACLTKDPKARPSASRLLNTKYLRQRSKPSTDFKIMVNSIIRAKSEKYQGVRPKSVADLEALAPAKSKHSRFHNTMKKSNSEIAYTSDDFEFSFSDVSKSINSIPPAVPLRQKYIAYEDASSNNLVPQDPPLRRNFAAFESASQTGCAIPMNGPNRSKHTQHTLDGLQKTDHTPKIPPRMRGLKPAPLKSEMQYGVHRGGKEPHIQHLSVESSRNWMRKALEGVKRRTQVTEAINAIDHLQQEIEHLDQHFIGFAHALIEELWRLILESAC